MVRFETETLTLAENRSALADLNGQRIDRFHDRNDLKYIVLDMDSSVTPPMATKRARLGTGIFPAPAITRTSCSTGLACWNAAPCAMATSTALTASEMSSIPS